jgi:hypothetical protein
MKGNLKLVDGVWMMSYNAASMENIESASVLSRCYNMQEIPVDPSSFIKIKSMDHDNSYEIEFEITKEKKAKLL